MRDSMQPVYLEEFSIPDAWFRCLYEVVDKGYEYEITRGSYEGNKRKEFDFVVVRITNPGMRPIIPDIPPGLGLQPPTDMKYVNEYFERYLLGGEKGAGETYTYGERINTANQIEKIIEMYKKGHGTNQAIMQVGIPEDIDSPDPPCLRQIDTRIRYGKLHFFPYFRSWDLWGGFPPNLAGIQLLKEFMAAEIGVEDGEIIASSKGLHLYEYAWEMAKARTYKD